MGILTEYPVWFILFCLLLGAVYAFLLYFRSDRETNDPWLRWIMTGCRFLAVSLISFLLLSPLIRRQFTTIEKPLIIIGQDNSQSMVLGPDSTWMREEYLAEIDRLAAELGKRYEVKTYSFGEGVSSPMKSGFTEKLTDISRLFTEVTNRYMNRNVGAVIVASDGIYTFGTDPWYAARDFPYPVYTIALGDTTDHRDLLVKNVLYNRQLFLGDQFPVEVQVDATGCGGETAHLSVKEKGKVVRDMDFPVTWNHFSKQIPLLLDAKEPGWHNYTIELAPVEGESTLRNNRQEIFVEVLDMRTKIVLVNDAPHPDLGAIRNALESNRKFELIERSPEEFLLSHDSAALVIFYQIPSLRGAGIPESVVGQLPAALFILGSQSDLAAFNRLDAGLNLASSRSMFAESYPLLNGAFPYFTVDLSLTRLTQQFPPLQSPFGEFRYSTLTEILAYQRINGVSTRYPMICFTHTADQKRGFITGENFWRWRITDYIQTGDHQAFDKLIQQIVQYLSVKQDRSFFRIKMEPTFLENEPVEIEAEVYNQSYELINEPNVSLVITDESGNNYPFLFGQTGSAYFLRAGAFPPGVYSYHAKVKTGSDQYEKRGSFVVTSVNLEAVNLKADHNLLFRLAESHRGTLVYPGDLLSLPEIIRANEEIHAISYTRKIFSELINAPWVFLLILGLLTAEWALRKYTGI
ncbi:MAG: hypothetical protein D4R67_02585 [Bacteroidetes bacterium]|nr:MAG: hypothetical protein D4R67_02585 [Bacteroidota bacterium]